MRDPNLSSIARNLDKDYWTKYAMRLARVIPNSAFIVFVHPKQKWQDRDSILEPYLGNNKESWIILAL